MSGQILKRDPSLSQADKCCGDLLSSFYDPAGQIAQRLGQLCLEQRAHISEGQRKVWIQGFLVPPPHIAQCTEAKWTSMPNASAQTTHICACAHTHTHRHAGEAREISSLMRLLLMGLSQLGLPSYGTWSILYPLKTRRKGSFGSILCPSGLPRSYTSLL